MNSKYVTYTAISPNHSTGRGGANIDTITIHCMAGNLSVETCGRVFAPKTRQASSNYGIDSNGRVGLYVNECDRSWCTSNSANDKRAVTIEVANDTLGPQWHVSDKAMDMLIKLVVDICERNGIKKLKWSTDKNERMNHLNGCNMTVHRDYNEKKSCPGEYLYNNMGDIANRVNALLNNEPEPVKPVVKYTVPNSTPQLHRGSKGTSVKNLQHCLNLLDYNLAEDGSFGPDTEKQFKAFQLKYMGREEVDGWYGPKSRTALKTALDKKYK